MLRRKGLDATKEVKPRVHVVRATAGMIGALVTRGFKVTATDMSPDVVGQNLGGVTVCDEAENVRLIKARWLPVLIAAATTSNTSTVIWAITGRNLGHCYTEQGVDCVISDPSPFFLQPGPAAIGLWRREF